MNHECQVQMLRTKTTKGAHQYTEIDDQGRKIEDFRNVKIGSIYLRKDVVGETGPEFISVTVNW